VHNRLHRTTPMEANLTPPPNSQIFKPVHLKSVHLKSWHLKP